MNGLSPINTYQIMEERTALRSSSRANGGNSLDSEDSLLAPSPLPSPPLSLLSPSIVGDPAASLGVKHGRGYLNESRDAAYARATECGGAGDYRLAGVLPIDGSKGAYVGMNCKM